MNVTFLGEHNQCLWRLVSTSDRVRVGVVIRSMVHYDLVKIKEKESEAKYWFRYDSVAYDLVKTRLSESQALFWYQTVIQECENKHCDWLVVLLLLPTLTISSNANEDKICFSRMFYMHMETMSADYLSAITIKHFLKKHQISTTWHELFC